jgi:hypothetical protein
MGNSAQETGYVGLKAQGARIWESRFEYDEYS